MQNQGTGFLHIPCCTVLHIPCCTVLHFSALHVPCSAAVLRCHPAFALQLHCTTCALQCTALQCNSMHCNSMHCNSMRCYSMQLDAIQYHPMQWTALQVQCNSMHCNAPNPVGYSTTLQQQSIGGRDARNLTATRITSFQRRKNSKCLKLKLNWKLKLKSEKHAT